MNPKLNSTNTIYIIIICEAINQLSIHLNTFLFLFTKKDFNRRSLVQQGRTSFLWRRYE